MNNPKYLIIHHSGGTDANPMADSSNYTVEQCNQDHKIRFNFISTLGYYVGYQYFIDKAGAITQCRADTEEGAHTIGKNLESIGICLAGNFDATVPTEEQIVALTGLLIKKKKQYTIPDENVVPHRTFATKTCYGRLLPDTWAQDLTKEVPEVVGIPATDPIEPLKVKTTGMSIKEQLISFWHTFIAAFATVFVIAVTSVPTDTLLSPATWKVSFVSGLLLGAVRATVKVLSPKLSALAKSILASLLE